MPASLRISNVGSVRKQELAIAYLECFMRRMDLYVLVTNPAPSMRTFLENVRVIPIY